MKPKYDLNKGKLDLVDKADESCPHSLQVLEFGYAEMEWGSSSYVFKKTFETGHLPPQVTIGHPDCGWTVRAVNEESLLYSSHRQSRPDNRSRVMFPPRIRISRHLRLIEDL
jgi:hypothetical protein